MRDVIDERNEKERISKSIIKYWNVNYVVRPVEKPDESAGSAAESEKELCAELMEVIDEETQLEEYYNAATGSYSGAYGKEIVKDEVAKGQIDKILHEKKDALRDLIEHTDVREREE